MTHFELLKYAKTGIASPGMTAYDKMRAVAMASGGAVKTLTGVPPLTFKANGKPLISWSMKGNGQQNGTPAPDAPIMPQFVGERTENLFDWSAVTTGYRITWATGVTVQDASAIMSDFIPVSAGIYRANASFNLVGYAADKSYLGTYDPNSMSFRKEHGVKTSYYNITNTDVAYVKLLSFNTTDTLSTSTMFNLGPTALPYEPYGYKIPITCAGQTVPIYLGQTQTVRRVKKLVLTGEEGFEMSETTQGGFYLSSVSDYLRKLGNITGVCTHYSASAQTQGMSTVPDKTTSFYGTSQYDRLYIHDSSFASKDDFKQWLASEYAAGTPVTVWYVLETPETGIVNEPLAKIGSYADVLNSEDSGVSIPTARGQNTLTVDTDLQPSSMTITYR